MACETARLLAAPAANHDDLDLCLPIFWRSIFQFPVDAERRGGDGRPLAQCRDGPARSAGAMVLPFDHIGPVRGIGRDQMPDRAERFDLILELGCKARGGMKKALPARKLEHGHPHRKWNAGDVMGTAIDDPHAGGHRLECVQRWVGDVRHLSFPSQRVVLRNARPSRWFSTPNPDHAVRVKAYTAPSRNGSRRRALVLARPFLSRGSGPADAQIFKVAVARRR
jgi:hypothetical protein